MCFCDEHFVPTATVSVYSIENRYFWIEKDYFTFLYLMRYSPAGNPRFELKNDMKVKVGNFIISGMELSAKIRFLSPEYVQNFKTLYMFEEKSFICEVVIEN